MWMLLSETHSVGSARLGLVDQYSATIAPEFPLPGW